MAEDAVLITDIIRKVNEELRNLEAERKAINNLIKQVRRQIKSLDRRETRLRAQIAFLVQRETELSARKAELENRLETTKKKFEKVVQAKKSISEAF